MADFIVIDEIQGYIDKAVEKRLNYSVCNEVKFIAEDGIPEFIYKSSYSNDKLTPTDINKSLYDYDYTNNMLYYIADTGVYKKKVNSNESAVKLFTLADKYLIGMKYYDGYLYIIGEKDTANNGYMSKCYKINVADGTTTPIPSVPITADYPSTLFAGFGIDYYNGDIYLVTNYQIYKLSLSTGGTSWVKIIDYWSNSIRFGQEIFVVVDHERNVLIARGITSTSGGSHYTTRICNLTTGTIINSETLEYQDTQKFNYYDVNFKRILSYSFSNIMDSDSKYHRCINLAVHELNHTADNLDIYSYTFYLNNDVFDTVPTISGYNMYLFLYNDSEHVGSIGVYWGTNNNISTVGCMIYYTYLRGNRLYLKQGNVVKTDASIYTSVGDKIAIQSTGVTTEGIYSFYGNTYLTIFNKGE